MEALSGLWGGHALRGRGDSEAVVQGVGCWFYAGQGRDGGSCVRGGGSLVRCGAGVMGGWDGW